MLEEEQFDYREALEKHRVEVVRSLDLDRQFMLSYLRSKTVLDDEDCEIIMHAGPSRQQKASKFLDVLSTKGPDGYKHYVQALEFEHQYLYEIFSGQKPVSQRKFLFHLKLFLHFILLTLNLYGYRKISIRV